MIPLSRLEMILKSDRNPTKEQREAMLAYFKKLRELANYQKSKDCNPVMWGQQWYGKQLKH